MTLHAVWLGYTRARAQRRLGILADVLLVVLFAAPSTVIGVGLIGLWNRAGVFGLVYGTDGMLLLAYLARFLPVAALALLQSSVVLSPLVVLAVSTAAWRPR